MEHLRERKMCSGSLWFRIAIVEGMSLGKQEIKQKLSAGVASWKDGLHEPRL